MLLFGRLFKNLIALLVGDFLISHPNLFMASYIHAIRLIMSFNLNSSSPFIVKGEEGCPVKGCPVEGCPFAQYSLYFPGVNLPLNARCNITHKSSNK